MADSYTSLKLWRPPKARASEENSAKRVNKIYVVGVRHDKQTLRIFSKNFYNASGEVNVYRGRQMPVQVRL